MNMLSNIVGLKWGTWALISLYISLVSGAIVGLQYEYSTPFFSTTSIDLTIPFGVFFRSLHFYSSQLFFFLTCFHLLAVYSQSGSFTKTEWVKLVCTLPIILLLIFTGYILRGDNTGASAGAIAENIIQAIPLVGSSLDNLMFSISHSGLRKIYLHHIFTLDIVLLILAWTHLRIYRIKVTAHLLPLLPVLLFSALIAAPLEPEKLGVTYISGPWFFLGLQELLRYFHPLLAGVLAPLSFIALLLAVHPKNSRRRLLLQFIVIWLLLYAVLTIIAWCR